MGSEQLNIVSVSPGTPITPSTVGTPASTATSTAEGSRASVVPNQSMVGLPQDSKTREQILRDRYLKGLKKRKCIVCGNTARARCPFHACKTCCSRAKNPCTIHVLKPGKKVPEGALAHSSYNMPTSAHSKQAWLAQSMQPTMGSGYLRPGYSVPSPYNTPTPVQMDIDRSGPLDPTAAGAKPYASPGRRSWAVSAAIDQQELQRQKGLRAVSQKEAMVKNAWRLQKLKEYGAGEMMAEDEAFDRYMLNASLLEEVFALNADGLKGIDADGQLFVKAAEPGAEDWKAQDRVDSSLLDAMRARLAADPQRKESSRQRLKQIIDRALRKLRHGDQDPELLNVEEDETSSLWIPVPDKRWEFQRSKAWTEKGRQVLKTVETFNTLMQKVDDVKCPEDVQACVDLYKKSLGGNLNYLLPNLYPREEDVDGCSSSGGTNFDGANCDGSLVSPRATLLNYLSGAFLEASPAGRVVISNKNKSLAMRTHKVKKMSCESGVEKLERMHWHRKYARGQGYWKVLAHDETLQGMCFERANAHTTIMEL